MPIKKNQDPYCVFKDDRMRLYALISRDLRYVAVVALLMFIQAHPGILAIAVRTLKTLQGLF